MLSLWFTTDTQAGCWYAALELVLLYLRFYWWIYKRQYDFNVSSVYPFIIFTKKSFLRKAGVVNVQVTGGLQTFVIDFSSINRHRYGFCALTSLCNDRTHIFYWFYAIGFTSASNILSSLFAQCYYTTDLLSLCGHPSSVGTSSVRKTHFLWNHHSDYHQILWNGTCPSYLHFFSFFFFGKFKWHLKRIYTTD